MAFGFGFGFGFWLNMLKNQSVKQDIPWIIDGSEVQQAPEGPTVIWAVNGSSVSNTEV